MSKTTDYISNTMSLREPFKQSLELLDSLIAKADLVGNSKTEKKIESIKKDCSLFEEFERAFPSVCFSIATGIGKTRLMGAFVTYLVKDKALQIDSTSKEKAWKYAIIPHDKTDTNMTFKKLVTEFGK